MLFTVLFTPSFPKHMKFREMVTCDSMEAMRMRPSTCTLGACAAVEWPHPYNRDVLIVGDSLLAADAYGGCSPVAARISELTSLNVETAAVPDGVLLPPDAMPTASSIVPPSFADTVASWVVISGGLEDLFHAHGGGSSLDLDALMSVYGSGRMAELVRAALRGGAKVALVSYPISRRLQSTGPLRQQFDLLMARYERFAATTENVFFAEVRHLSHRANASRLFDAADTSLLSWRGGLDVGSVIGAIIRASLPAAGEEEAADDFEAAAMGETPGGGDEAVADAGGSGGVDAPLTCGVRELVARELAGCSDLDLEGELRKSELFDAANTTVNASIEWLAGALSRGEEVRLKRLRLSSNAEALRAGGLASLALGWQRHGSLRHIELAWCNLTAADVELVAAHAPLVHGGGGDGGGHAEGEGEGGVDGGVDGAGVAGGGVADGAGGDHLRMYPSPPSLPPSLRTLSLAHNPQVGAAGAAALASSLLARAPLAALTALQLTGCSVGVDGARSMAAALAAGGGDALESLALDQNGLGDEGVTALAAVLAAGGTNGRERSITSLHSLDLSANGIGASGIASLATALATSRGSALHTLWLHSNAAGDSGAASLAHMLERNTALRVLGLLDNAVSLAGTRAIEKALRANRALGRLDLTAHNDLRHLDSHAWRVDAATTRNAEAAALGGEAG